MNHSPKGTEYPKCGGKELGKGKHSGSESMFPYNKALGVGVEHIICSEYGFIIENYVKNTNKFKVTL